jgi:hypothetical protein
MLLEYSQVYGRDMNLEAGISGWEFRGGEEGTGGSELVAGVGVGGGQLGSNAMIWLSLAANQPCGT